MIFPIKKLKKIIRYIFQESKEINQPSKKNPEKGEQKCRNLFLLGNSIFTPINFKKILTPIGMEYL